MTSSSPFTGTTVEELALHVGMSDECRDGVLAHMGATLSTPLRTFTTILPTEVESDLLVNVKPGGNPLNMISKGAIRLFFLTAEQLIKPPVAAASSAVVPTAAAAPAVTNPRKMVKLSLVLKQTDESTCDLINESEHIGYLRRFEKIFGVGRRPMRGTEPNNEQLSALKAVLADGSPPYADFAIFGPHATRTQRKMKLQGTRFTTDGQLGPIEILGPSHLEF